MVSFPPVGCVSHMSYDPLGRSSPNKLPGACPGLRPSPDDKLHVLNKRRPLSQLTYVAKSYPQANPGRK